MSLTHALNKLLLSYPDHIKAVDAQGIRWKDNSYMALGSPSPKNQVLDKPSFTDQVSQAEYPVGKLEDKTLTQLSTDPGRVRHQPFFEKMYGSTQPEIEENLKTVFWLSELYSDQYPMQVTSVNGVHQKLTCISSELCQLPEPFHKFIKDPLEAYVWRDIAGTNRLSAHSLGIAFDINVTQTHYWQWELEKEGKLVNESTPLTYQNTVPWEIILIFEKYGFIWGGKWHHYDTMHFEYRPEML